MRFSKGTEGLEPTMTLRRACATRHRFCMFVERGCRYFTVLREPRERLYSHYTYVMASGGTA